MIATTRLRRLADIVRHLLSWPAAATLFALAPKCLLCVAAYAGIGAILGLGGREICGVPTSAPEDWAPGLVVGAASLGFIGLLASRRGRRRRATSSRIR